MSVYEESFDVEYNLENLDKYTKGIFTMAVMASDCNEPVLSISEFLSLFTPIRDAVFKINQDLQKRNEKEEDLVDKQPDNSSGKIEKIHEVYGQLFNLAGELEDGHLKKMINTKGYELKEIYESMVKTPPIIT